MNKTQKIILIVGAVLIALRLIFPVLQCKYEYSYSCKYGQIIFFTFNQPVENYAIHTTRTYTQAVALGLIIAALFFVSKNNKSSKIKNKISEKSFNTDIVNDENIQSKKENIIMSTEKIEIKLKDNEVFAGVFERFGARIIDSSIIGIAGFLIGLVFGFYSNPHFSQYFWYAIYGIYESLLIYFNSATIGKKLFNLRVVSYYANKKISFFKSLLRFIIVSIPLVPWSILFDEKSHRGWHDNLADTAVIRDKSKSNKLGIGLAIISGGLIIAAIIISVSSGAGIFDR